MTAMRHTLLILVLSMPAARAEPLDWAWPVDLTLEVVDAWTIEVAVPGEAPAVHEGVVRSDWRWFEGEDGVRRLARTPGRSVLALPLGDPLSARVDGVLRAGDDVEVGADGTIAVPAAPPWRDAQGVPDLVGVLVEPTAAQIGRAVVGLDGVDPAVSEQADDGGTTWTRSLSVVAPCPVPGSRCVVAAWTRRLGGALATGPLPSGGLRVEETWWLDAATLVPVRMTRAVEVAWQPRRATAPTVARGTRSLTFRPPPLTSMPPAP